MTSQWWKFICACFIVAPLLSGPARSAQNTGTNIQTQGKRFRVFDGTTFRGKPNLAQYGMEPANIVYEASLFNDHSPPESIPQQYRIDLVARSATPARGLAIIDVERWIWLPDATNRYVDLMRRLKEANPRLKTGFYSIVPNRDYWRAKDGLDTRKFREWQQENDQLQPVADSVDYLFPSLYTFYDNRPGWVAYAEANIAEARRLAKGKPVYVFLWPTYHESNVLLKGKSVPADFWRLQLETVRRLADGVVIWGGSQWDPQAPWWLETQKFLSSLAEEN